MKKFTLYISVIAGIALLALSVSGQRGENVAVGKAVSGTFSKSAASVDGKERTAAVSGKINASPQLLTIDLGEMVYVGTVKIKWDPRAASQNYSIRFGKSRKVWMTSWSGLDASKAPGGNQIINTTRYVVPTQYVQIYIPIGSVATADRVKISEIEVIPATNLSFRLDYAKPYAIGDNSAIVAFKTSIGAAAGQVLYGNEPSRLDKVALANVDTQLGSANLVGLEPGKTYFFKVKAWDANNNMVESRINTLKPFKIVSRYRPVKGTFVALPPNDKYVNRTAPVLPRVVDGRTNYFDSMATSGSIRKDDQFVTVDLGSRKRVKAVITYWRALAYPESFEIRFSSNGRDWEKVVSKVSAGDGAFARSDAGDPMKVVNIEGKGKSARYVQVRIPKDSPIFAKHAIWDFVQLMEVEVTI